MSPEMKADPSKRSPRARYLRFALPAIALALLLIASAGLHTAKAQQIIAGTNKGTVQVIVALPEFQPQSMDEKAIKLTTIFNQVLWDDLDYSGNIALVSRSFYPKGNFQQASDIKVEDWTGPTVKAQYLAFGHAFLNSGTFGVEVHFWDLNVPINRDAFTPKVVSLPAADESGARQIAHNVADIIVDSLFGGQVGIAKTKIAFQSDRTTNGAKNPIKEVWVMDYDGENQFQVTNDRSLALFPAWSPDGQKLALTSYRKGPPNTEIVGLDRRLYPFPDAGGAGAPAWSPDGSRIAFATSKDGNNGPEIYVADWNGLNMKRLTIQKGIDMSPTWNPRGTEIAFVSDRSGSPQIWMMDDQGGNPQRVVSAGGDAVNPSWSPDGQFIAFAWQRNSSTPFDIYLHNLATGKDTQLTHDSGNNDNPSWAPDGRHIVFASNRSGHWQIYSMLADGTKLRALTKTGDNAGPAWSGFTGK